MRVASLVAPCRRAGVAERDCRGATDGLRRKRCSSAWARRLALHGYRFRILKWFLENLRRLPCMAPLRFTPQNRAWRYVSQHGRHANLSRSIASFPCREMPCCAHTTFIRMCRCNFQDVKLSVSHDGEYAVAVAVHAADSEVAAAAAHSAASQVGLGTFR